MIEVGQQLRAFITILKQVACLCAGLAAMATLGMGANHPGPDDPGWDSRLNDLIQYEGRIVDTVLVEIRNVYDTTLPKRNTFLFRTANRLHTVTREKVIRRELLIISGEPFDLELARETTRNLRTHFELYDAVIHIEERPTGHIEVHLRTIDQWSTFVKFHLTRDTEKTGYRIGIQEHNLAGNNQLLAFDYIHPGDEHAYMTSQFFDQRFFGLPYSMDLQWSDNPEYIVRHMAVERPYYNLNQDWSFGVSLTGIRGRRDAYEGPYLVAQSRRQGERFEGFMEHRWGSYRRKIGLSFGYTYFFEQSHDPLVLDSNLFIEGMIAQDSVYHFFEIGTSFRSINYIRLKRINGMGYSEDLVSGQRFGFGFGRAFNGEFEQELYDRVSLDASVTELWKKNLVEFSASRALWIRNGDDIQVKSLASLNWYNFASPFITIAARLRYDKITREDQVHLAQLGGKNGIRGYNELFASGNERLVFNAESRLFTNRDVLSVLFGAVLFWDAGRVWSDYRPVFNPGWHHSIGLGLRVSLEKSARSQLVRIDLARALEGRWELLVGTGQYF